MVDFHETLSFAFLALVLVSYVITRPPTVCAHALYLLHHAGAEWAVGHLDTRPPTVCAHALYLLHHAGAEWAVGHLDTRPPTVCAHVMHGWILT